MKNLSVDQLLSKARSCKKKGDLPKAKLLLESILATYPKNKRARLALTEINQSLNLNFPRTTFDAAIKKLMNLYEKGMWIAAIEEANKLIKLYPSEVIVWNILGTCAAQIGQSDTALFALKRANAIRPDQAEIYNNMGNVLKDLGRIDEAISVFEKALRIKPNYASAYNNLGNCLKELGKFSDALINYQKAITLKPDFAEAHHNLGTILSSQYQFEDALAAYNRALQLREDYPDAYDNLGRMYWLQENFIQAFELMEWRWRSKGKFIGSIFNSNVPLWDGSCQQRVLVWKEQGVGDEIMFSSLLNEMNSRSDVVVFECDRRLIPLFERSFPSEIQFVEDRDKVTEDQYDFQIAMGSLPRFFRHDIEDFSSSSCGWLQADNEQVQLIREKIQPNENEKVIGISWFTNSKAARPADRCVSLELFAKYLKLIPGKYVNLQYGDVFKQIKTVNQEYNLNILTIDEIDLFNDLDGLASLISACDLIISIDNLTVHFAGALGIDTKLLLPKIADERWSSKRNNSYWYDSLSVYRQDNQGDWHQPLSSLVTDLTQN